MFFDTNIIKLEILLIKTVTHSLVTANKKRMHYSLKARFAKSICDSKAISRTIPQALNQHY